MIAQLRLFTPESQTETTTLRCLFEDHLLPDMDGRAKKTLADYQTTIKDWERLMADLPITQLSRSALLGFQELLTKELKPDGNCRSPATVNKKMRVMGPLVRLAWPADSHNPGGLGLCDYFKPPGRLKEAGKLPYIYSRKELNRLYQQAENMTWPPRWAAMTWRTIFVIHYCCGPRTFDLLSCTWDDVELDYSKGIGSISFQAAKTSKLQRIPLNPVVRQHLIQLKSVATTAKLFPHFQASNYSTILRHWKKLIKLAEIPETCHMEDFRKTCNTAYNDKWPGVGNWILGHGLSGVNARNYYNPTKIVLKAVQKLPLPKAFRESVKSL